MEQVRRVYVGWRRVLSGFLVTLFWSASAFSAEVTLAWDPNSEPDLAGYGIYLHKNTPGSPDDYHLAGYISLDDLDDVSAPLFVVSGLEKGARYYFVATAYDTAGNESAFSNSVCADVGDTITPCPAEASSSAGGGGGGCFIGAASEANAPIFPPWTALLAIPGCILLIAAGARHTAFHICN